MIPRAMPQFHVFDHGTLIYAEVRNGRNHVVDLSEATTIRIIFMRPDGSGFMKDAQLGPYPPDSNVLPGSDGTLYYIVEPGDWDTEGQWFFQFYIEVGAGAWYSSAVAFTVFPNIVSPATVLIP
jgi:hypothetical protein